MIRSGENDVVVVFDFAAGGLQDPVIRFLSQGSDLMVDISACSRENLECAYGRVKINFCSRMSQESLEDLEVAALD